MIDNSKSDGLFAEDLEKLLEVSRKLASPFDLITMLSEVAAAAKQVLASEAISIWLYEPDTDELVLQIASNIDPIRVPSNSGIVGHCASTREFINTDDCYTDRRFNPDIDKITGFKTRNMLSLPLIGSTDNLVGIMQVLNKHNGSFDKNDERIARYLSAQCALAIQRAQMMDALVSTEKLVREVAVAREVQMSTLPDTMPDIPGIRLSRNTTSNSRVASRSCAESARTRFSMRCPWASSSACKHRLKSASSSISNIRATLTLQGFEGRIYGCRSHRNGPHTSSLAPCGSAAT